MSDWLDEVVTIHVSFIFVYTSANGKRMLDTPCDWWDEVVTVDVTFIHFFG